MVYQLSGLHCKSCAKELEDKINEQQEGKYVEVDYENSQLKLSERTNERKLKKVLNFEKVLYSTEANPADDPRHGSDSDHHHHHHSHDLSSRNTRIVFFLNAVFAVIEFIFGGLFSSRAIISDAIHDTGDALSIGLAWIFQKMSTREANQRFTFGYQRFSLLGAVITSVVLIVGSFFIILESIPSVFNPTPVYYQGMFFLAVFAIAVKLYCMRLMSEGETQNEKMLNLHMLEDVFGWVAVLVVSIVLFFTDWYILDPLLSIGIGIYILYEAIPMFIDTIHIFLEASPSDIDLEKLENQILSIETVNDLSHLHVWSFDGEENVLTVTILTSSEDSAVHGKIRDEIRQILFPHHITHSTIEIIVDEN